MQQVSGVVAVDLDVLNGKNAIKNPTIPARIAYFDQSQIQGAELLLIDPEGITLTDLPV